MNIQEVKLVYTCTAYNADGERIAALGSFGSVDSARQAILDHANVKDLPDEDPFRCPEIRIIEGWLIGRTQYLIEVFAS